MSPDPHDEGGQLAREWRELREALLEFASKLPETRANRATDRPGWTFKHELAHLASIDQEVRHLVDSAREGWTLHHEPGLRRIRGQAMHSAQEMRLARLREHLASAGEMTATTIEEAGEALGGAVQLAETEAVTVAAVIRARLQRAREGVTLFQQHFG